MQISVALLVERSSAPRPAGTRSKALIDVVLEIKRRNPRIGCPRIAQEIAHAFGIDISKDIVRRVLAKYYRPVVGTDGPCSHWVMVVMDVFTRRIIGFGVSAPISVVRRFVGCSTGSSPERRFPGT